MISTLGYNPSIWGEFYNPSRLLSTNKPLLMSVLERNNGKSTAWGIVTLSEYIKLGKRGIYARRTEKELVSTVEDYFVTAADILSEHGEHYTVHYTDREFFLNEEKEPFFYAVNAGQPREFKSRPFGDLNVRNIIYDEAILPRGDEKMYIGATKNMIREYERLTTLYQTVDRAKGSRFLNETRLICIANNSSFHNPLFLGCNCSKYVDINTKFCNPKNEIWALELDNGTGAKSDQLQNAFSYRMATQEDKQNYYKNDSFHIDSQVKKLHGIMNPICNFSYAGHTYAFLLCEQMGICYISTKPRSDRFTMALTVGDTKEINQVTAYKYNKSPYMQFLSDMVNKGLCVFETENAKTDVLTYLNFTL